MTQGQRSAPEAPRRYITEADFLERRPVYAIWEVTLRCNLKCLHCGSRAGQARPVEMTTAQCLSVVRQLAAIGVREVTLIGGEAYLRKDWLEIVAAVRAAGMDCSLGTGGLALVEKTAQRASDAGLQSASVSIDGLEPLHDELRGVPGSFKAALRAVRAICGAGMVAAVTTQINRRVIGELPELMDRVQEAGAQNWQVQLTMPMGNAADHSELLLQPFELLEVMPLLGELFLAGLKRGLLMQAGNNLGYFGPTERFWRGDGFGRGHWIGCNAGTNTIGIQADGAIKGCSSLPTASYVGGSARERPLEEIWTQAAQLTFNTERGREELWGFCRSCYYADLCKAGCTWTSHVLFGRRGNNPFCHHRALQLEQQGLGERLVKVAEAGGQPFDHGRFEVVVEPLDQLRAGARG